MLTDLNGIWQGSAVPLVGSVLPQSVHGLQAKPWGWGLHFLYYLKCTRSPARYSGSSRCQWQTHKRLGGRLCRRNIVSNVGGARTKKRWFFRYPAHSLQFFCKLMLPMESVYSGVPFGRFNPPYISISKWGNPKPRKKYGVLEVHFIHPIRHRKFTEFNGEIIFQIRPNVADIARKLAAWAAPGQLNMASIFVTADSTKLLVRHGHLELTLVNSVVYSRVRSMTDRWYRLVTWHFM